jgi:rhamnogalacturonyl hydrolase YesR
MSDERLTSKVRELQTGAIGPLSRYLAQRDFAGFDAYDALNSPLIRALTFNLKYGRIAWIQLLRRLPFNVRPLLGVRKGHNPKGLGLFLGGYSRLFSIEPDSRHRIRVEYLFGLLQDCRSDGFSGNCWGYNFDWQSRAFYVPKYTPTIVNSGFIGHALLDAYELLDDQRYMDMAIPIKNFLLNDLNRTKDGDTFCFSYTPIDNTAVHNANLLGASLLIRLYGLTGEDVLRDAALSSLAYTMKHQREDGSWFYAEASIQQWIDSFHTGFNLESVRWFRRCGEAAEYEEAYHKGVSYYAQNFFLADGTPKYYHDRVYPIDIHAPAEAITFFAGEGPEYSELAERVLSWMLTNMRDEDGYFYFRKGRRLTNKIPYMRWSQAWAFRALTEYAYQKTDYD